MKSLTLLVLSSIYFRVVVKVSSSELEESETGAFVFLSNNVELKDDSKSSCKQTEWKHPCEESKLMSYLSSLQVINPVSVIALATKNKLDKTCQNVSKTIDRMQGYMKTCSLQPQQATYNHLLKGVTALHHKLCTKDAYRKSFMNFKSCFSQLQSEFDSCNGPADWLETCDPQKVCKAYQEIADCYYIKSSVLCGNRAADVFKELVNAVIDSVITVNCSSASHFASISKQLNGNLLQGSSLKGAEPHKGLAARGRLSRVLLPLCALLLAIVGHLFA